MGSAQPSDPMRWPMNDGHSIPPFGFGVAHIADHAASAAVETAVGLGYRLIDTAAGYGNERGVGRGIRSCGIDRNELFVTTKLDNPRHGDARRALEESLESLDMAYADLYLIHWPCPARDQYVEAWRALVEARDDGLVRSIGVSNFLPAHLRRVIEETSVVPAVNQIEAHPTFAQADLVSTNTGHGILTQAWSPLGVAQDLDLPVVADIADRIGATPAQTILAWHLHRGRVVFPKASTIDRLAENLAALHITMSEDEAMLLDAADVGHRVGPDPATYNGW